MGLAKARAGALALGALRPLFPLIGSKGAKGSKGPRQAPALNFLRRFGR